MINILFIDDEPHVLAGLRRMLRPLRDEWQMFFADSGAAALEMLKTQSVDVVVSDMRMPGMDGAQLLARVQQLYPNVVRIILSGYSEKEMILKAVGAAHQYLAKPCDAEVLKFTVKRACNLRDLLSEPILLRLVSQMSSIPSLPALYHDLITELQAPEPAIKKIGAIVGKDLGMTAKILQMVNSAFFGLQRHISDPGEATLFLGLDTIGALVLAQQAFSKLKTELLIDISFDQLWEHSCRVGTLARSIAESERPELAPDAFTAGLLHDIGKVILAVNLPQQCAEAFELQQREGLTSVAAETQVFGTTHARVGAYLLGLWGLPNNVVEAVAYHHDPANLPAQSFTALTAIYAADKILHSQIGMAHSGLVSDGEDGYLASLDMRDKLPQWQAECQTCVA